jgi:Leucine-rich repeat (LRR) protein
MFKYLFLCFSIFLAGFSCNNIENKPQNAGIVQIDSEKPTEPENMEVDTSLNRENNKYVPDENYYLLASLYIEELLALENIEKLDIDAFDAPKDLSFINNLTQLKELEIFYVFKDYRKIIESLNSVNNLPNLEKLTIYGTVDLNDVNFLKNFPGLRTLHIDVDAIENISALKYMHNLEKLRIGHFFSTNDSSLFSNMKKLKELDLRLSSKYEFYEEHFNLPNLETLNLRLSGSTLIVNRIIPLLPNLKKLRIDGHEYHEIANIGMLKNLEELDIHARTDDGQVDLIHIGTLERLKRLIVSNVKMDSIINLKNSNLEYLYLGISGSDYHTGINLERLSRLTNLKELTLDWLTVNDVRPLLKFPNLETVDFGLYTTYGDISPLAESKTIKNISIWAMYYNEIPKEIFENRGITLEIHINSDH